MADILCPRIIMSVAQRPRLVGELIPKAFGPMTADMRRALNERSALIEDPVCVNLDEPLIAGDTWNREFGAVARRATPRSRELLGDSLQ